MDQYVTVADSIEPTAIAVILFDYEIQYELKEIHNSQFQY